MRSINLLHRKAAVSPIAQIKEFALTRGKWALGFYLLFFVPLMAVSLGIDYQIGTAQRSQDQLRSAVMALGPVEEIVRNLKNRLVQIQTIINPSLVLPNAAQQLVTGLATSDVTLKSFTIVNTGEVRLTAVALDTVALQGFEQQLVRVAKERNFASLEVSSVSYDFLNGSYSVDVTFSIASS